LERRVQRGIQERGALGHTVEVESGRIMSLQAAMGGLGRYQRSCDGSLSPRATLLGAAVLLACLSPHAHGSWTSPLSRAELRGQPLREVSEVVYDGGVYSGGVDAEGLVHGIGVIRTEAHEFRGGGLPPSPPREIRTPEAVLDMVLPTGANLTVLSPPQYDPLSPGMFAPAEFVHGQRSGHGQDIDHASSTRYEGMWENSARTGRGCWFVNSSNEGAGGHCGVWENNNPKGCGSRWNELEPADARQVHKVTLPLRILCAL